MQAQLCLSSPGNFKIEHEYLKWKAKLMFELSLVNAPNKAATERWQTPADAGQTLDRTSIIEENAGRPRAKGRTDVEELRSADLQH